MQRTHFTAGCINKAHLSLINSVSQKFEYYIRSIKKDILNRNVRLLKSMFISMHSILCMNYCINAAWNGGNQPEALLRCNGSVMVALIAAFRSSALLGLVSLIFLLTIPHRFSMLWSSGQASLLANQAQ